MSKMSALINRWDSDEGKPYKSHLIDWGSYDPDNFNIGCMCAQGQVLHEIGGWSPEKLRETEQREADKATAALLNISVSHAVLLRSVNDSVDGAPSIVLTDPGKVLGDEWSRLLDFWCHLDTMSDDEWMNVGAAKSAAGAAAGAAASGAARYAASGAAWGAARSAAWEAGGDAAGAAARSAARSAAKSAAGAAASGAASYASNEIQGQRILRGQGKPFLFLPMFGFATPEEIPARPEDYGIVGL